MLDKSFPLNNVTCFGARPNAIQGAQLFWLSTEGMSAPRGREDPSGGGPKGGSPDRSAGLMSGLLVDAPKSSEPKRSSVFYVRVCRHAALHRIKLLSGGLRKEGSPHRAPVKELHG